MSRDQRSVPACDQRVLSLPPSLSTAPRISSIVRRPSPVPISASADSRPALLVQRDRGLELGQLLADQAIEAGRALALRRGAVLTRRASGGG